MPTALPRLAQPCPLCSTHRHPPVHCHPPGRRRLGCWPLCRFVLCHCRPLSSSRHCERLSVQRLGVQWLMVQVPGLEGRDCCPQHPGQKTVSAAAAGWAADVSRRAGLERGGPRFGADFATGRNPTMLCLHPALCHVNHVTVAEPMCTCRNVAAHRNQASGCVMRPISSTRIHLFQCDCPALPQQHRPSTYQ